ncbi:MAG: redoxin domain-containing protein [Erythrobacter sp.]
MACDFAPPLQVTEWLNTPEPITLASLRGKVVLLEAFQMLCPGCVSHSLPQAQKARQLFKADDLAVIGLHTVFEHFEAQGTRAAIEAFLHEYRITFPVGIDAREEGQRLPQTMQEYHMQGTPTTILIDHAGTIRKQKFGREDDMLIGAEIMALIAERSSTLSSRDTTVVSKHEGRCDSDGCQVQAR